MPLSREHHDGLLLCWKIRFGIKNELDAARIAGYVRYFWDTHLKEHFLDEEKYLFPLLPADDSKCIRAVREHRNIEAHIIAGSTKPSYPTLSKLADELEAHIRFEERDLFNTIEQLADKTQLEKAGVQIADRIHATDYAWNDRFWEKPNIHVL